MTAIETAVDKAGGQRQLADVLGVTQQAVSLWLKKGYVPPLRAVEIEMQFGISRNDLINPRLRRALAPDGE